MKRIIYTGAFSVLLAACASAPQHSDELDRARAATEALAQQPLAQQAASKDLADARTNLQAADIAVQQHKPLADIDHLAYLAERHAQTGEARVQEAEAR